MDENSRRFFVCAAISTLASMAGYMIAPIEVRYLSTLTDNTILIGATFAIGSVFFAMLSIWLGRLSDRVGRERLILAGLLAGVIYPLIYASTYNIFAYMGVRFVWAFSGVATGPIFMAYMQDLLKESDKKGQYFGTLYSAQSIAGSAGALIAGFLGERYSLASPYYAMAAIFLVCAIIGITQIRVTPVKVQHISEKRSILFSLKYVLKKPELRFYFAQNAGFGIGWGIKPFLWPLIIYSIAESDAITGSIFATMGICAFLILPFAGKYADARGYSFGAFMSMMILGLSSIVIGISGNIYAIWAAAAIYAIGEAFNGPSQAILLTEHVDAECRGEILGLDSVIDRILQSISPLAAGLLLAVIPAQKVLLIFSTIFWATLLITWHIKRTQIDA